MKIVQNLFAQLALMWKFLGFFQSPLLRIWHILGIILVFVQLLMFYYIASEGHVDRGLLLVPFIAIFLFLSFKKKGIKYFYSYLWGDVSQFKKDIQQFRQGLAIAPRSGGLPALLQGFGLLCFFATVFSGFFLYLSYEHGIEIPFDVYSLHADAAIALALYFLVHALVSIRHFLFWKRAQNSSKKEAK